jgi:hypothetical protein
MACKAQRLAYLGLADNAQFIGNSAIIVFLGIEESKLAFLASSCGRKRILDNAGERGISHDKTTRTTTLELMGEQTEGIGVAFEVSEVTPELRTYLALKVTSCPFGKVRLNGLLATMAKRWIAQIMSQTGSGYNLSDLLEKGIFQFRVLPSELLGNVITQRHANARYLQGVGETIVNEDTSREWKDLCLVLQTTEGSGENQTIIVAFELRSVVVSFRVTMLLSESLIRYKLLPIHHN